MHIVFRAPQGRAGQQVPCMQCVFRQEQHTNNHYIKPGRNRAGLNEAAKAHGIGSAAGGWIGSVEGSAAGGRVGSGRSGTWCMRQFTSPEKYCLRK